MRDSAGDKEGGGDRQQALGENELTAPPARSFWKLGVPYSPALSQEQKATPRHPKSGDFSIMLSPGVAM